MLLFDFMNSYIIYIIFVFTAVFIIYAIFTKTTFINKHKNRIITIATILLIWTQIGRYMGIFFEETYEASFWIFNFKIDGFSVTTHLPFYMCRLSVVVLLYYTITKDKRVEFFLFFWGALGLAGVIYPNGEVYNIVNLKETFFIDHFLLAITPFFLVVYQKYVPTFKDLLKVTALMALILYLFIPLNQLIGSDYFYLKDQSIFGILFPGLPSFVFATAHYIAAFGFFSIYYLYFRNKKFKVIE